MKFIRKFKVMSFVVVVAILLLAAPGYSWTHGGGYNGYGYRGGYHHNYHSGYHAYRGAYAPYGYRPYYGYSGYYGPSVSFSMPFPLVLPGFSFYVGP